eukprot:scaffold3.g6449.t1
MALPAWADRALEALALRDRRRLLGLSFILAVAVIWVLASFIVQDIERTGVSPAVLTFIANSLFSLYLPIYYLNLRVQRALQVAPLWYLAQLTFNMSLHQTGVTSNTILSSTSALFTFLFSMWLLAEVFTLRKLGCILLLIAGTAMVTLADSEHGSGDGDSVQGDLLCLLSAGIYGGYTVALRRLLREDEETSMTLFFGFMGGLILAAGGPLLGLAAAVGAPLGSLSLRQFGWVVAKGLLDNVLSDYLWARAILLVGPTVATGGLSMQVPLAVAIDAALRSPPWPHYPSTAVLTFLGATVVLVGFFGLNTTEAEDERGRQRQWEERAAALQTVRGGDEDEEFLEEGGGAELGPIGAGAPLSARGGGGGGALAPAPAPAAEQAGGGRQANGHVSQQPQQPQRQQGYESGAAVAAAPPPRRAEAAAGAAGVQPQVHAQPHQGLQPRGPAGHQQPKKDKIG